MHDDDERRVESDDAPAGERGTAEPRPADDGPDAETVGRKRAFPLALIAGLGGWKVYEAIAVDTVAETVSPSLYVLGVAAFAISVLGPRSWQLLTFFAGAILCLAAIAVGANL
jgi:hypothetical protein